MIKDLWLNLPVKDVNRSREFYTKIGFVLNEHYGNNDQSASFYVGAGKTVMMLFSEDTFKGFAGNPASDTKQGTEVLFSIGAESREDVDEITKKAEQAGGAVFGKPAEIQGWMYGCGFCDPDGHRWNVLFMDLSKMSK
jgi:predicted lactoylglutathione lyase